mgnify:CR=1 FL=1
MSSPPSSQGEPFLPTRTSTRKKRKVGISTTTILLLIGTNGVSFLGGVFLASNRALNDILLHHQQYAAIPDSNCPPPKCPACPTCLECPSVEQVKGAAVEKQVESPRSNGRFKSDILSSIFVCFLRLWNCYFSLSILIYSSIHEQWNIQ